MYPLQRKWFNDEESKTGSRSCFQKLANRGTFESYLNSRNKFVNQCSKKEEKISEKYWTEHSKGINK